MPDLVHSAPFSYHRIKEANAGMWQDFYSELRPFGKMCVYYNDFVSWVPDEWTITEINASTQTLLDERNGILRLTPAGSENDGSNMQLGGSGDGETIGEAWAAAVAKNLWFECRVRSNTDIDQNDVFVGLHVQDTTIIAGRGSDYIGFRIDDGDALIDCESSSGSSSSEETSLVTGADATFYRLGFKITGTSKAEFYVDDVLQATISTNIPTALMKLSICHLSGEASANVFDIDYVAVCQER